MSLSASLTPRGEVWSDPRSVSVDPGALSTRTLLNMSELLSGWA